MGTFQKIIKFALVGSLVIFALGCGSGSSSQNLSTVNTTENTGSSGTGSNSVTITKTALTQSENTTVTATFTKSDGTPSVGVNVSFSTTLGAINPATTTTDAQGLATATLMAGATSGQGQVAASAAYDGKTYVKTGNFQVSLPPLTLSPITLGLASLSYGGSTSVSVTVKDANGATYTALDVDVIFTSTQATLGKATINSPVKTVNGVATTTYQASTVTGSDTITASIAGSTVTATLTVIPLSASAITFVSVSPANIGLKGMGGLGIQETSKVTFKVIDTSGQPKANQQVDFTLNTSVGGLSLSSASGSTGSDGTVSTFVQSGVIATSVRVTATLRGVVPIIATQSDQLVVSTGVPAQDGFSISVETLNPEAWNTDGVIDKVTARLSDHFHNPVPDGTAVYFTTSGGSIQPSCTTVAGACTVNWISQAPRPANGRARILAYAVGEEAFLDIGTGNGLADAGEFADTPEAYRDDNEDSARNANETFIDFNSDSVFNGPDGNYNGVLQGAAYVNAPKSKHVFSNSTIVMASSEATITSNCGAVLRGSYTNCSVTVSDVNGNTMPAGTTVEFKLTTIIPGASGTTATSLAMPTYDKFTFPNSTKNTGIIFPITISDPSLTTSAIGQLEVKVTSPKLLVTIGAIQIN